MGQGRSQGEALAQAGVDFALADEDGDPTPALPPAGRRPQCNDCTVALSGGWGALCCQGGGGIPITKAVPVEDYKSIAPSGASELRASTADADRSLDTDFAVKVVDTDSNYQELISSSGVYTGQVHPKTGKFHGLGVLKSGDCVTEGEWREGVLCGRGKQTWPDGRRYLGDFVDGVFSGKGRMEWPHTRGLMIYEGEYKDDKKHGEGLFIWPSGKSYQGQWREGRREGFGVDISPTGVRSAGIWKDNMFVAEAEPPTEAARGA